MLVFQFAGLHPKWCEADFVHSRRTCSLHAMWCLGWGFSQEREWNPYPTPLEKAIRSRLRTPLRSRKGSEILRTPELDQPPVSGVIRCYGPLLSLSFRRQLQSPASRAPVSASKGRGTRSDGPHRTEATRYRAVASKSREGAGPSALSW